MNNNTTSELNFNLSFFQENFETYKLQWDNGSAHPEYFYTNFYEEFISGEEDKFFTAEDKAYWKQEWIEALDDEELSESTFEEILEENDYLTEDLTEWIINSDEPKFAQLKEKFIAQLFFQISEEWSKEEIAESIKDIEEAKKA